MKNSITLMLVTVLISTTLSSCGVPRTSSGSTEEHYVSSQVKGEDAKINLDEVKDAFWSTKGKDFNEWMGAFEKRVNEIYEGDGIVSIDATRKTGNLLVTGYIENQKEQGYQDGEEKLFSIEQTGDVTNDELPYKVAGHNGQPYYQGSHSILDNPFVQMMVLSHLMGGWGGRYYTPYNRTVILRDTRDAFRTSPSYSGQKTANQSFNTRYKRNLAGTGVASKKGFGTSSYSTTSGTTKRSWGGFGSTTNSSSGSKSVWGGRRSTGGGIFGGGRRGWGGRRGR
jgi:hypothetical protein